MSELRQAMEWLAAQPGVLFVGQGIGPCGGTRLSADFEGVPEAQRVEFPVAEELQLGLCVGLSLEGFVPVSVFPRASFLLRCMDQLVNHLDRLPLYSGYRPRVIVRTSCVRGALDAGPQHDLDQADALRLLLRTVDVVQVPTDPTWVLATYQAAYQGGGSAVMVEGGTCS